MTQLESMLHPVFMCFRGSMRLPSLVGSSHMLNGWELVQDQFKEKLVGAKNTNMLTNTNEYNMLLPFPSE